MARAILSYLGLGVAAATPTASGNPMLSVADGTAAGGMAGNLGTDLFRRSTGAPPNVLKAAAKAYRTALEALTPEHGDQHYAATCANLDLAVAEATRREAADQANVHI